MANKVKARQVVNQNTQTQIIGITAPVPMGDWQSGTTYFKLNLVRYNGATYIAKEQNTGVEPTVNAEWQNYWQAVVYDGLVAPVGTYPDMTVGNATNAQNDGNGENIAEQFADINEKIPSTASAANQLADKAFVNSSINNMAAFYITYSASGAAFPTRASLLNATTYYYGGQVRTPTQNDYAIVLADESQPKGVDGSYPTTRYSYQGTAWSFQYVVNNTSLTQAQVNAINSGITAQKIAEMEAATAAKYTKPSSGIPKTDLSSDVQTSLDKADKAEPAFTKNTAFNKNFGAAANTVCEGDDDRLSDSRTPKTHASNLTTYGVGNNVAYGHVMLSNNKTANSTSNQYNNKATGTAEAYSYHLSSTIDLNNYTSEGHFTLYNVTTRTNFPPSATVPSLPVYYLEVKRLGGADGAVVQALYVRGTTEVWVRYSTSATSWGNWVNISYSSTNLAKNQRISWNGISYITSDGNKTFTIGFDGTPEASLVISVDHDGDVSGLFNITSSTLTVNKSLVVNGETKFQGGQVSFGSGSSTGLPSGTTTLPYVLGIMPFANGGNLLYRDWANFRNDLKIPSENHLYHHHLTMSTATTPSLTFEFDMYLGFSTQITSLATFVNTANFLPIGISSKQDTSFWSRYGFLPTVLKSIAANYDAVFEGAAMGASATSAAGTLTLSLGNGTSAVTDVVKAIF